jgi:hypothetical protein
MQQQMIQKKITPTPLEELISSLQMYVVGTETNAEVDKQKEKEKEKSYLFNIKEKDKLLWAFYIMLNGEDAYKYLKTKFVADKEIRIKSVEKLHKMSNVFKQHKLNKGRIESELSSDVFLSLEGFFGLCIIHNLSAMFIKKNCYCELYGVGDTDNPYLVEEVENGIGIHIFKNKDSSTEMSRDIRKTKWKMENISSPVKSISSYTLAELLEIYNKIKSCHFKEKKTKQYLYDCICEDLK